MQQQKQERSRLERAVQVSKIALAISLTTGALVTANAKVAFGDPCNTIWSGCKTGSCDPGDGNPGCCTSSIECMCVAVSPGTVCPC